MMKWILRGASCYVILIIWRIAMQKTALFFSLLACLPAISQPTHNTTIPGLQGRNGFHLYSAPRNQVSGNRLAAEWEPVLGSLIQWPLAVPKELVIEVAKDDRLYLMVNDEAAKEEAAAALKEWGVNPAKVQYVMFQNGGSGVWIRDYGPHPLFCEDGQLRLADPVWFHYPWLSQFPVKADATGLTLSVPDAARQEEIKGLINLVVGPFVTPENPIHVVVDPKAKCHQWSYKNTFLDTANYYPFLMDLEDAAPRAIADSLKQEVFPVSFSLTGGNVTSDGRGTAFSMAATLNENYHKLQIEPKELGRKAAKELGFSRYFFLPSFEDLGIQHLDCMLKLINEDTFIMAMPPKGHRMRERYQTIGQFLSTQRSSCGSNYKVIPIDTPTYNDMQTPSQDLYMAAYTNAYILNKKVMVPLFGLPQDQPILEAYRKAMPGYEVVGIMTTGEPFTAWMWFDALHCRVRSVWDSEMLYMSPITKPKAAYRFDLRLPVLIKPYSQKNLIQAQCKLFWRVEGQTTWSSVELEKGYGDLHNATIPGEDLNRGDVVNYYFQAADQSGRLEKLPRTAPGGFYSITVQ